MTMTMIKQRGCWLIHWTCRMTIPADTAALDVLEDGEDVWCWEGLEGCRVSALALLIIVLWPEKGTYPCGCTVRQECGQELLTLESPENTCKAE
jgi:hypothetical protein